MRRAGQVGTGIMAAGEKGVGRSKDAETGEPGCVVDVAPRDSP